MHFNYNIVCKVQFCWITNGYMHVCIQVSRTHKHTHSLQFATNEYVFFFLAQFPAEGECMCTQLIRYKRSLTLQLCCNKKPLYLFYQWCRNRKIKMLVHNLFYMLAQANRHTLLSQNLMPYVKLQWLIFLHCCQSIHSQK